MFLLDTDTLIYSLKGDAAVVHNLERHRYDPLKISVISLMALYYGAYKSRQAVANLAKVRRIENAFEILPLELSVAATFGMLKAGLEAQATPLDDFDLVVAAGALAFNLTLVTNNERHFRRIEGLKLENWTHRI
ncbi:MAG: type II toxin-antitoxin system VapC family toxin [Desulfobacteraceae bacterium]|jgi:tRNA(fMet)-specific endonuclease VapC|nr:type II toxin-antitoxin system VapC family toxin [Desulfobacteraceae bacterium]